MVTDLPDPIREQWLAEVESYRRACGCKSGAACAIGALVLGVAWWSTRFPQVTVAGLVAGAFAILGLTVLGAIVGKLAGIGVARFRFHRAMARLVGHARLAARQSP